MQPDFFDDSDPAPLSERSAVGPAGLPAELAGTEHRLQQFRPRQPQVDMAMLQSLTHASSAPATPPPAGISRAQFASAVAGSWLCGVAAGVILLLYFAPGTLERRAGEQTPATAPQSVAMPAPGSDEPANSRSMLANEPAANRRPITGADDRLSSSAGSRQREPALVATGWENRFHTFGASDAFIDQPLRVASLRRWSRQSLQPLSPLPATELAGLEAFSSRPTRQTDTPPDAGGSAMPRARAELDLDAVRPPTPMTRQRVLDELLGAPPAAFL